MLKSPVARLKGLEPAHRVLVLLKEPVPFARRIEVSLDKLSKTARSVLLSPLKSEETNSVGKVPAMLVGSVDCVNPPNPFPRSIEIVEE